jgi:flavin-dependent thymidylate synthase
MGARGYDDRSAQGPHLGCRMSKLELPTTVSSGAPVVKLLAYTEHPFDLAVASARTCYQPNLILAKDITEEAREKVGRLIYDAGHHTPFQHPTFVFGLENISRQFTWSFLHSHPFYNSEQSSQRYVLLKEARVHRPAMSNRAAKLYDQAVLAAWAAYNELTEILLKDLEPLMLNLGRIKGHTEKRSLSEARKKAIETARYVVPVAAFTTMYHTVSGIELQRYLRMMHVGDTPAETKQVVEAMVAEVQKVDPDFMKRVGDPAIPAPRTLEAQAPEVADPEYAREFDRQLAGRTSRLVAHTQEAERLVAEGVREVLGASSARLSDDDAIDLVVNPGKNRYLLDPLNVYTHSPLMRVLNHPHYTFKKKISHAADSQDQRHRMVPGSRPLLTRVHTEKPDYHTPSLIATNPEARRVYEDIMDTLWTAKNELIHIGESAEAACYLLPNAVNIRFTESGNLLNLIHKWRLRTCFNAQLEIYDASMDELLQARDKHPRLLKHMGPPCVVRDKHVEDDPKIGPCSEGDHWCGIKVWNNFPNVKRPF